MSETVEQVSEGLTRLEVTVAKGFHEMELRFSALNRKIDVNVESLRGDIQGVAELVTSHIAEMRRTTEALRKEHAADREVLRLSLLNHAERIHVLQRSKSDL